MLKNFKVNRQEIAAKQRVDIKRSNDTHRVYYLDQGSVIIHFPGAQKEITCGPKNLICVPAGAACQIINNDAAAIKLLEVSSAAPEVSSQAGLFAPAVTTKELPADPFKNIKNGINGEKVHEELFELGGISDAFSIAICVVPKGGEFHTELHRHPREGEKAEVEGKAYEESYIILSGTGSIMVAGKKQEIKAGDIIDMEPGQWHQLRNTSIENDLVFAVVCGPKWCFDCMIFPEANSPAPQPSF